MWLIKNRLIISFLIGINVNSAFAGLIEIPTSTDRLDQLSRAISNDGSYVNASKKEDEYQASQTVLPEDYGHLKIKPLYQDSKIDFYPKKKEYYETKIFKNNIFMIKPININYAMFIDLDLDEKDRLDNAWVINCTIDNITDEKTCIIKNSEFLLLKSSKKGLMLTPSQDILKLNPNRFHYLRVDKNPPFKTKFIFTGPTAYTIINQMKNGEMLYTRFYERSDSYDETISLYGFSPAYETMNLIYSQLK